jgi:hypothetical protein
VTKASIAALLLGWLSLLARDARAEGPGPACPAGKTPWVHVVLEGAYFGESLRASVLEQIATDLERRGLAACAGAAGPDAVAEIRITLARPASLAIELRDQVSHERFAREVSLARVPPNALGLSIAATAEELLYASIAQNAAGPAHASAAAPSMLPASSDKAPPIALAPAPSSPPSAAPPSAEPPKERPPVSDAAPAAEVSSARPSGVSGQACVLGAGEAATQGVTALGADLGFSWGGRLTFGARAGFRLAPEIASDHGIIEMREGVLRLGGAYALVPRTAAWGGEVLVRGDLLYVEFDGVASSAARALSGSGIGVALGAGFGGWVRLARSWSLIGEVTGGFPIHAVTASDNGTVVTGVRGLLLGFALGVATRL